MSHRTLFRNVALAAAPLALVLTLGACSSTDPAPAASPNASEVLVGDPWVKAVDSGMTAAFMTLTNTTDKDLVVVSASTPASTMVELHETVMSGGQMVMQPKAGGFTIPAGGEVDLTPGGNHIMLMDVDPAIRPGDTVPVTLTLDDGSSVVVDALAKDYSGADESYSPGGDSSSPMDMGSSGS